MIINRSRLYDAVKNFDDAKYVLRELLLDIDILNSDRVSEIVKAHNDGLFPSDRKKRNKQTAYHNGKLESMFREYPIVFQENCRAKIVEIVVLDPMIKTVTILKYIAQAYPDKLPNKSFGDVRLLSAIRYMLTLGGIESRARYIPAEKTKRICFDPTEKHWSQHIRILEGRLKAEGIVND